METVAQGFDYGLLTDETRFVVEAARDRIKVLQRKTSESIVEIGRCLIQAKNDLPHGQFGPWLEGEFGWSAQSARRFMQVAEVFGENAQIERFQPSALYALASGEVPEEVREEFQERAEAGETITHREVQAAIQQTKPQGNPEPAPLVEPAIQSPAAEVRPSEFVPTSTAQYREVAVTAAYDQGTSPGLVERDNEEECEDHESASVAPTPTSRPVSFEANRRQRDEKELKDAIANMSPETKAVLVSLEEATKAEILAESITDWYGKARRAEGIIDQIAPDERRRLTASSEDLAEAMRTGRAVGEKLMTICAQALGIDIAGGRRVS